ncbi:low molecular weight protein-tyrosine-phosphatase [Arenibacter latericius]|uniref:low molecular weight protein-tyrosine-phosphatase n=1 Tax=Arenibacter latericius TaxID=86104 RepID=UPI000403C680|nr:low molecular weight protein-tyrosine-phosphatase [Arenibacter latericius]MDX1364486.1 low molecular weight protein-tyrosine-phosphatase [Arenibacter latericius]
MSTKVLMVCLGNICRSPLAEGILKEKIDSDKVFVDSAGTANYHIGKQPDPRSIAVAKKHGIDISGQRCRQFTKEDFKKFDYIYAMDKDNYANILALATNSLEQQKVKLILHKKPSSEQEVPDPYYGGDDGFENVFQLLDSACEQIAEEINQKHSV